MLSAAPAAGSANSAVCCPQAVVRGLSFEGGAVSIDSVRLRRDCRGLSDSGAGLLIEVDGLEARLGGGGLDPGSFSSALNGETLLGIPRIKFKNSRFVFEGAPPDSRESAVYFNKLSLIPADGYIRLEIEDVDFGRFQICRLEADARPSGDSLLFPSFTGMFAGGELEGRGELNLVSFDASAAGTAGGVLLEELTSVLPGNTSGTAGFSFDLSGNLLSRSLSGSGAARLSGGDITGIPVLFGLAPAFLRAAYRDAVFSEGEAYFSVSRGTIRLEGARLDSEEVFLQASGTLGMDGKLDITVDASFKEGYMRGRAAPVEVLAHVLRACDFLVIRHRVSGNVSEPSYELMPLPLVTSLPLGIRRILGFLLPMRANEVPNSNRVQP